MRFFLFAAAALSMPAMLTAGCGGDDDDGGSAMPPSEAGAVDRMRLDAPYHPDASCPVTIETPDLLAAEHVPEGSAITWSSNPPSSGPHFPIWAAFTEFTAPVPRGYLVHSMEHGAVVLFYRCDLGSCPRDVELLRAVRDAQPVDPICDPSIARRIILAPRPALDVAIAAAAWGFTYRADCVDPATLSAFVADHYGKAPESTCAAGRSF